MQPDVVCNCCLLLHRAGERLAARREKGASPSRTQTVENNKNCREGRGNWEVWLVQNTDLTQWLILQRKILDTLDESKGRRKDKSPQGMFTSCSDVATLTEKENWEVKNVFFWIWCEGPNLHWYCVFHQADYLYEICNRMSLRRFPDEGQLRSMMLL